MDGHFLRDHAGQGVKSVIWQSDPLDSLNGMVEGSLVPSPSYGVCLLKVCGRCWLKIGGRGSRERTAEGQLPERRRDPYLDWLKRFHQDAAGRNKVQDDR